LISEVLASVYEAETYNRSAANTFPLKLKKATKTPEKQYLFNSFIQLPISLFLVFNYFSHPAKTRLALLPIDKPPNYFSKTVSACDPPHPKYSEHRMNIRRLDCPALENIKKQHLTLDASLDQILFWSHAPSRNSKTA
jgi:hypothetical protein